ncbi:hypothetical protein GGR50DRAFT_47605 [Xylaria sp. CBS 124048]|nr:hypothetical protein GGR50DRAFT_47605 [Xylaria sp. CBS 124048]
MLGQSVRASRRFLIPGVVPRATGALTPIIRRRYAESHFPDEKVESLHNSQNLKISNAIQEDHNQLRDYYNRVITSKNADEQERYGNALVWELARHSIAEELVVYPAIERELEDGRLIADKDRDQHQVIKEKLYEFQKLTPADPGYLPTLKELFDDLKVHFKEEEEHDLVELEKKLSLTETKELSSKFERTKMLTPTRSHPSAPNKPPFLTVVGLMTAPIDKLRDLLFTKFPEKKTPDLGSTGHGVGKSER